MLRKLTLGDSVAFKLLKKKCETPAGPVVSIIALFERFVLIHRNYLS